jgi:hypothetical protein
VRNGKTEVEFIRFPVDVCTDRGRAMKGKNFVSERY